MKQLRPNLFQKDGLDAIENCQDFQFMLTGWKARLAKDMIGTYEKQISEFKFSLVKVMVFTVLAPQINLIVRYALLKGECGYVPEFKDLNRGALFTFRIREHAP